jgi:hypothetical protein
VKVQKIFSGAALVLFYSMACVTVTSRTRAAETNSTDGGLLNAVGGFLSGAATGSGSNRSISLQSLESAFENSATNSSPTVMSLTNRLHSFLGTNTRGATNPPATTNLIAKLTDWLNVSQRAGTNVATNTVSKRAWTALTNAIASHSATNSASSNAAGGDLVTKLRDWVATERQKTPNTTNTSSASLAAVENYLHSLTSASSTNAAATTLTNSLDQARTRLLDRFRTDQAQ